MDFTYCVFNNYGRNCLAECKTLHVARVLAKALSNEEENIHEQIIIASYDADRNNDIIHAVYKDGEEVTLKRA